MSYFLNDEERQMMEFFTALSPDERLEHDDDWYRVMFIIIRDIASELGYARDCRLPQCRRARLCRARSDLALIKAHDWPAVFPPCAFPDEKRRPIRAYVKARSAELEADGVEEEQTGEEYARSFRP